MLHDLLSEIVDYAGLFPPAGLAMKPAVENYAQYLRGSETWMLGRFVLPIGRLTEFLEASRAMISVGQPWRLSVLVPAPVDNGAVFREHLADVRAFNARGYGAQIDSIETRLESIAAADLVQEDCGNDVNVFWEMGLREDVNTRVAWVNSLSGRHFAKARTGGIESAMIPDAKLVAEFIANCVRHNVGFKATAGLHHPLRSSYRLTYEPESPCATMYGFLNVFVAAVLAQTHWMSAEQIATILESQSIDDFVLTDEKIGWGKWLIGRDALVKARREFAISFGSCSFAEPVEELQAMGLLSQSGV